MIEKTLKVLLNIAVEYVVFVETELLVCHLAIKPKSYWKRVKHLHWLIIKMFLNLKTNVPLLTAKNVLVISCYDLSHQSFRFVVNE